MWDGVVGDKISQCIVPLYDAAANLTMQRVNAKPVILASALPGWALGACTGGVLAVGLAGEDGKVVPEPDCCDKGLV